jgi:hypothetical protein
MTGTQWILAGVAVALWVLAYFWFFHADVSRWMRWRAALRAEQSQSRREQLEQQARMIDELAERYQLPPSAQRPRVGPTPGEKRAA